MSDQIDPAPRHYPPAVRLLRRSRLGASCLSGDSEPGGIEPWLLGPATRETDLLVLFEAFVWRLVAAGLPLDRVSLHVGTLHPQLAGFSWVWNSADGFVDEVQVPRSTLLTEAFTQNPLYRVVTFGESFRCDLTDPDAVAPWPLMRELRSEGFEDYLAEAMASGDFHNAVTAATRHAGGLDETQVTAVKRCFGLFGLLVGRHIAMRIAGNVLDTYLGAAAGRQVLEGSIERGSGAAIDAVIWVSDLRGFTDFTGRLPGAEVLVILNAYFEAIVGAVMAHGGEVLKFIGDGLLAVFPLTPGAETAAAARALAAARAALEALDGLEAAPPAGLAAIAGWRPLKTGIALHEGRVFFGNVGAPERLDFTVIGRAVNEASRVETLCKVLDRQILVTSPVAQRIDEPLEDMGRHDLRGLDAPTVVFAVQ